MKILMLSTHFNCGGITSYILNLSRGLICRRHIVAITSSGGDSLGRLEDLYIPHFTIPIRTKCEISPRVFISALKLISYVRRNDIDLIHSHTRVTQVLGCIVSKFTRVPHVTTCHGFFKRRLSRRLFPCWGRRVIAISDAVREHLITDFAVGPDEVKLVYNGVDTLGLRIHSQQEKNSLKKRFGLKKGPVIGIVARLSDVKGHRYLIEALPLVLKDSPQAQLFIIGEGKQAKGIKALIRRLDIGENVIIIPSVTDTAEVLSVMDIFVMPSLQEGLGLALMEAMAEGLAIVASDIGGIPSLIKNNYTGLLVQPRDSQALADAIISLLKDKSRAFSLGERAKEFAKKNFSIERMTKETERVYRECIGYAKP